MFYVEEKERKDEAISEQPVTYLPIFFYFALYNIAHNAENSLYVTPGTTSRYIINPFSGY